MFTLVAEVIHSSSPPFACHPVMYTQVYHAECGATHITWPQRVFSVTPFVGLIVWVLRTSGPM